MKIIVILIIISIFSCRSIQYVPVENKSSEKTERQVKDSFNIINQTNIKDSTIIRDSVIYIYKEDGTLLRTEIYRLKEVYKNIDNLYKELQQKYDSLSSVKRDSVQVPYPVEVVKHKVPGVMWWLILLLAAFSIPSVFKIIRFIRGKI